MQNVYAQTGGASFTLISLGIETLGKVMTVLIPRNTFIPTKKVQSITIDTENEGTSLIIIRNNVF